jgi:integrase
MILSLEMMSKKFITLVALTTAHRMQTFSKISIDNIAVLDSQITVKIPELVKSSRVGHLQPLLVLPFFNEKPEICPAKTLIAYLNKTSQLRGGVKQLFLSFRKPYRAVSTQTLSRWVRSTLESSGIDVEIFKSHSTRHASTSAALRLGVSLDVIKRTAGWSGSSNTFFRFYNRNVCVDSNERINSFAEAIIGFLKHLTLIYRL